MCTVSTNYAKCLQTMRKVYMYAQCLQTIRIRVYTRIRIRMYVACTFTRIHVYMYTCISLWDVEEPANTEHFQGSPSLLPRLCPLSVPKGGVCGVYSESP